MADTFQVISPVDGSVYAERRLATDADVAEALERARTAQRAWQEVPLGARIEVLSRALDAFTARRDEIAREITWQMGRPIRHAPREVDGFDERARHMLGIAEGVLADITLPETPGVMRFIRRVPLGVVFVIAPWNYPYLTAVNGIWPALVAGNAVILKHAAQTPLCAERIAEALDAAGLPEGTFQYLHADHEATTDIIASGKVDHVDFTGSLPGAYDVVAAASRRLVGTSLALGGKDPAYVRPDADLDDAIRALAEGAFFNSGQSCSAIERIYVHEEVFEPFVEGLLAAARHQRLGDPTDPETTLGPLVKEAAADFARDQVMEAARQGAMAHIDPLAFPHDEVGSPYMAPQVLTRVDHSMRIMTEETFGPAVGVMSVSSDDEATRLMNDSRYGLTAAIWTTDVEVALSIGERVETGTWFMNRCDDLDPALPWSGTKDSGRGCSLSHLQYERLTRPKSFHLRTTV